jgi:hypothetical protein
MFETYEDPNECPKCGNYLSLEPLSVSSCGDYAFARVECKKCGWEGEQHYALEFLGFKKRKA